MRTQPIETDGQRRPTRFSIKLALAGLMLAIPMPVQAGGVTLPDNDTLMRALVDEMDRSLKELTLKDLARPYLIQFRVEDRVGLSMSAQYGGLTSEDRRRSRSLSTRVRVGGYELDNTNFRQPYGWGSALPIDDNYQALRHAIWLACDTDYKQGVENLTRKEAYLKTLSKDEDRPVDYTKAEPVVHIDPSAEIAYDEEEWRRRIIKLSARFQKYPEIQDSNVSFAAGVVNSYVVNTEGTRLRRADTGVYLTISADLQAADGMYLADELIYLEESVDRLPSLEEMLTDVDKLCAKLIETSKADILEHYVGPVLFDPVAAGQVFDSMLAGLLAARPVPLGRSASPEDSMERKIGIRILPRTFHVYDDPTQERFEDQILAGWYDYDDEGVATGRVQIVEKGVLKNLVAGRAPTKKIKGTTGHARASGFRDPVAIVGCLYFEDEEGLGDDELKEALIEAAREEGLDYAIRITGIRGGGGRLGEPIRAYKVFVEDGREVPIRGVEFLPVQVRSLKRLLAAGKRRKVYNSIGAIGRSVISPAIIAEELELTKIQEEKDRLPYLDSPAMRAD